MMLEHKGTSFLFLRCNIIYTVICGIHYNSSCSCEVQYIGKSKSDEEKYKTISMEMNHIHRISETIKFFKYRTFGIVWNPKS